MVDFFINRGYPTHIVHKARGRAASIDRQTSLGSGDSATNSTKLPLVLPFDHINRKVSAIIHKNAKILSEDESIGSIFDGNIITAYKRTSNLKDLFVVVPAVSPAHTSTTPLRLWAPVAAPKSKTLFLALLKM